MPQRRTLREQPYDKTQAELVYQLFLYTSSVYYKNNPLICLHVFDYLYVHTSFCICIPTLVYISPNSAIIFQSLFVPNFVLIHNFICLTYAVKYMCILVFWQLAYTNTCMKYILITQYFTFMF